VAFAVRMDTKMSPTVHLPAHIRAIRSRSRALRLQVPARRRLPFVMRNRLCASRAIAWLVGGAIVAVSGRAAADACPTDSTTVFTSGSSAFVPVLKAVAKVLGSSVKIVNQAPGSCEGLDFILEGTKDTDAASLIQSDGTAVTCTLPTMGASAASIIDIGFSDVYPSTCSATFDTNLPPVGAGFADFLGPVQAMTIAVPTASTENIISAEAAYMVFGFAAATPANTIAPWSLPGDIYVRFWDSGTLEMIGKAIGLPGGKWVNATNKTSAQTTSGTGGMQTAILNTGAMRPNSTIGILSTSGLKTGIKALAFQGTGQQCSYLPDSAAAANDKINVRQGRYEIWGPEHMVTAVDNMGKPVGQNSNTAAVQILINALLSTSQALPAQSDAGAPGDASAASDASGEGGAGVTVLGEAEVGQLIAQISLPATGFIPWCAMQVKRTAEIGAESSYSPPAACSCAYEVATGGAIAGHTCTMCTSDSGCSGATPKCHFGYCEAE
jgi:ABC-type phosphate transport system substrate-binding protein